MYAGRSKLPDSSHASISTQQRANGLPCCTSTFSAVRLAKIA